nr:MAG TPA: hypothetical protein [Caudoviricetes sp.]
MCVSYVFTAYINLSVHNRQVLRLMYKIRIHAHTLYYIVSGANHISH